MCLRTAFIACICFFATQFAWSCNSYNALSYIENKGQWANTVLYRAGLHNGAMFLEKNGITLNIFDEREWLYHYNHTRDLSKYSPADKNVLHCFAYQIQFLQSNPHVEITAQHPESSYYNYFLGRDRSRWASYVKGYEDVYYKNLYDNTDLRITSMQGVFKYEFILHPGASLHSIQLNYAACTNMFIQNEKLYIVTPFDTIVENTPYIYQNTNGRQQKIKGRYVLNGNVLGFELLEKYDPSKDLIIDPVVIFSTYSGSTADNFGYCATYDSRGNAYAGGSAFGNGYPTTLGAYQLSWAGGTGAGSLIGTDMAITKYSSDGSTRIYSTYLGGNSDEVPHSLIVNSNDELFILGTSSSTNYPCTPRAFDTTFNGGTRVIMNGLGLDYLNGSDMVVTRFSADGASLLASTYLGGSANDGLNTSATLKINYADEIRGEIQIDENDNVYIGSSTYSSDFPVSAGAFQPIHNGGQDACLVKMDNNLSLLVYSTFIGGNLDDAAYSVEIDKAKNIYFTGGTSSATFPLAGSPYRSFYGGGRSDAYVAKLNPTGTVLLASTLFGSNEYDQSYFVRLNKAEEVFLYGQTLALADTFIINAGYFNSGGGQFISKFKNALDTIVWSTAFGTGGKVDISPTAFLVDLCSKVYLAGWGGNVNIFGGTSGFPFGGTSGLDTTSDAIQAITDNSDFYLLVIEDDASAISFGSYFGGLSSQDHVDGGTSRFDKFGIIYQSVCASCGRMQDFPIYPHPDSVVSSRNNSSNCNNAVFKIDFNLPFILADFSATPLLCAPANVTFVNESRSFSTTTYEWNFGDGSPISTLQNPTHTYTAYGSYTVRLIIRDPNACNIADTAYQTIFVLQNGRDTLVTLRVCDTQSLQIGFPPINDTNITYNWVPATQLNFNDIANPIAQITGNQTYVCYISIAGCTDTFTQVIEVDSIEIALENDTVACPFDTVRMQVINFNPGDVLSYTWQPTSNIIGSNSNSSAVVFTTDSTQMHVVVSNVTGCKDSVDAWVYTRLEIPRIIASFTHNDIACLPATLSFTNSSTEILRSGFQWSFGDGATSNAVNPSHTYIDTGTYVIRLIQNYSILCVVSDTFYDTIHLRYPIKDTLLEKIICEGEEVQIGISCNDSFVQYQWTPSSSLNNDSICNPLAQPTSSTLYTCAIQDANCEDTLYQWVRISQPAIDASDTIVTCPGLAVSLYVQSIVVGDTMIYNWQPLSNILDGENTNRPLVFTQDSTQFIVQGINQYGCIAYDTLVLRSLSDGVQVSATAESDSAEYLQTIQLNAVSPDVVSYSWSPSSAVNNASIANPTSVIRETSTFIVQAIDSLGCIAFDTVVVYRKALKCGQSALFIPNAFSPNSDGNNDILYVRGKNLLRMYFAVYDRWGEKVFETDDINTGWDGMYKGKKLDPAVFGYVFEGVCENGETLKDKGNITLIR